jgi:hypothetical protein
MAIAIHSYHSHEETVPQNILQAEFPAPTTSFLHDLSEDIRTTREQMQGKVNSNLFNKHLLTLANCYLALIVLLLCGMVPFLYLVNYNW